MTNNVQFGCLKMRDLTAPVAILVGKKNGKDDQPLHVRF